MRLGYGASSSHLVRGAKMAVIDPETDSFFWATADRTRSRPGVHGTLKENTADGFPPQDCAAVFDYYYMEFQY